MKVVGILISWILVWLIQGKIIWKISKMDIQKGSLSLNQKILSRVIKWTIFNYLV